MSNINTYQQQTESSFDDTPTFSSSVINSSGEFTAVELVDSKWMAMTYQETFQRLPIEEIRRIPEGMFVKVYCIWPFDDLPSERFWVEIVKVQEAVDGSFKYFGELRNDTLIGKYGDVIGPITSESLCDVDINKFLKEKQPSAITQ